MKYIDANVDMLTRETAEITGTTVSDIAGRKRTDSVSRARSLIWFIIRTHFEPSVPYEKIGDYFNRDHGTVIHGVRLTMERFKHESDLRHCYLTICEELDITPIKLPKLDKPKPKLNLRIFIPQPKQASRSGYTPDPKTITIPGRWRNRVIPEGVTADPEPYTMPQFVRFHA